MADSIQEQLLQAVQLHERGALREAVDAYRRVIALNPSIPEAHYNLGSILRILGELDAAADSLITAVQLRPGHAGAWNNLANTLHDLGMTQRAMTCYRQALEIDPNDQQVHDNVLLLSYYDPAATPNSILSLHRAWGAKFADPLTAKAAPHTNDRTPDRVLRVGYVSSRFCESAEYFFLDPLFQSHDPGQVEVYCYSETQEEDDFSRNLRALTAGWRTTLGVGDDAMAKQIREDRIDILVDLAGHGRGNRVLVFARKPAPVQVAYLSYPGTMGLSAIDYRFSDSFLDPQGHHDHDYVEKTIRLPGCYWCYQPWEKSPPVGPLKALTQGFVTFGSLNRFDKITPECLPLWADVLKAVPGSKLLLYVEEGSGRGQLIKAMNQRGIGADRIAFVPGVGLADYLKTFDWIDIALDPFPVCGATTTCHALWMGVPVVSLVGPTVMGRSGSSILNCIGRGDLVARTAAEYVQIAVRLAGDLEGLADQRAQMRERVRGSPLLDAKMFTRGVEQAYRRMWENRCQGSADASRI